MALLSTSSPSSPSPKFAQPKQLGDPEVLTAANFMNIVRDPHQTVIVFFYRNLPEDDLFIELIHDLACALRKRPDIIVARFDAGLPDNQAFVEYLQQPSGPIKNTMPRIVAYPKGNKDGIKFRGLPGGYLPRMDQVRSFVFDVDYEFPSSRGLTRRLTAPPGQLPHRERPPTAPSIPPRHGHWPIPEHTRQLSGSRRSSLWDALQANNLVPLFSPSHSQEESFNKELSPSKATVSLRSQYTPFGSDHFAFRSAASSSSSVGSMPSSSSLPSPRSEPAEDPTFLYAKQVEESFHPLPPPTGVYRPPRRKLFG